MRIFTSFITNVIRDVNNIINFALSSVHFRYSFVHRNAGNLWVLVLAREVNIENASSMVLVSNTCDLYGFGGALIWSLVIKAEQNRRGFVSSGFTVEVL